MEILIFSLNASMYTSMKPQEVDMSLGPFSWTSSLVPWMPFVLDPLANFSDPIILFLDKLVSKRVLFVSLAFDILSISNSHYYQFRIHVIYV